MKLTIKMFTSNETDISVPFSVTSPCSHGTAIAVTVWTIRPDVYTSVYMSVSPAHTGPVTARLLPEPSVTAWDDYTSLNALQPSSNTT